MFPFPLPLQVLVSITQSVVSTMSFATHPHWITSIVQPESYSLGQLAEYLDLEAYNRPGSVALTGLGRNCDTFDRLRLWAYRNIGNYGDYNAYHEALIEKAGIYITT
jgi:hypothetical protein